MIRSENRSPVLMLGLWLLATLTLWGFAFFPTAGVAPEWLEAARNACFGTMSNGLPETSGWMVLTLGPVSFLIGLFVTWPKELKGGLRDLRKIALGKAILAVLVMTVVWEASWVGMRIRQGIQIANADFRAVANGDLPESYPLTNRPAPDFELIDQSGSRFSLKGMQGKTVFLTFAFAHCQTVCPSIVNQVRSAVDGLSDPNVRLVIITLDPWRDTPRSLPFLAQKWKLARNSHVLSGEVPEVTRVLDLYQVPWKRDEKNGDIAHPALTYVIGPDGKIAYTFNNASVAWLIQSVQRVTGRTPSKS